MFTGNCTGIWQLKNAFRVFCLIQHLNISMLPKRFMGMVDKAQVI